MFYVFVYQPGEINAYIITINNVQSKQNTLILSINDADVLLNSRLILWGISMSDVSTSIGVGNEYCEVSAWVMWVHRLYRQLVMWGIGISDVSTAIGIGSEYLIEYIE